VKYLALFLPQWWQLLEASKIGTVAGEEDEASSPETLETTASRNFLPNFDLFSEEIGAQKSNPA